MRCFASILLLAAVAYAATPDLNALCKEKYGEEQSSGSQSISEQCKVQCRGTKSLLALHLFLEDGTTCAEGKSCLKRNCVSDADVEACKAALKDEPLDHIHSNDCVVKCHAVDTSKNTETPRADGGKCGMFSIGTCKAGRCAFGSN